MILCAFPIGAFATTANTISEEINQEITASTDNLNNWIMAGAYYDETNNHFVLTPDHTYWTAGAIWYNKPIDDDFVLEMDYYSGVTDRSLGGADGLVVAFYANNEFSLPNGGTMGFNGCKGYGVEIDTYYNSEHNDPSGNHVALIKEQVRTHIGAASLPQSEDGQWHHLKVEVIDAQCRIYVDNELKLAREVEKTGYSWLGVTSATGNGCNLHAVKNIAITTAGDSFNDSVIKRHLDVQLTHLKTDNHDSNFIEYEIVATINNTVDVTAKNVQVSIELPNEMTLIDDELILHQIGDILSGTSATVSWIVRVPSECENQSASYAVDITVNSNVQLRQERPIRYGFDDATTIAVFTTEKSLSVQTNKSMWLAFGLMEKGELNGNWEKMSITVSDPTIIELSEYEETEYGYSIEVIGKKQGTTNITITDTKSGANTSCIVNVYDNYTKSYTYNITGIATANDGLSTNIYDLNGLYVSNYNCTSNGSYYYVSMDLYNNRYHTGSVDVYDVNDNWIASYPIEKYNDISSLWDTGEQAFYLVSDWANNKIMTYQQASFAKHTPITNIEVPEGGYIVISNNFSESVGTFFYNASEILFEATVTWLEAAISLNVNGDLDKSEFIEMLMGEILKDPNKRDAWMEIFNSTLRKELETFATKLLIGETSDAYSNFADDFEDVLNSLDIEWKHLFQSATGVGESAFTKFAGPAGVALEACFTFTGYGNKILRAIHIATSIDEPYATAFSSVEEGYINPHGVMVNTGGNMDAEAVLQVFKVSNSDTLEVVLDSDNPLEKYELYNISFVKNDKNVQPNGNVKVYIPIPKDMIGNTSKIYRQENDGSWTMLDAHIEDNYLVFETEHFSLYAIIGDTAELVIKELPSKIQYVVGDTLNLEGLTLEINGQLITTGYVCEPTVLSQCGEQEITVVYGSSTAVFNVYVMCSDGEHNPQNNYLKNVTHHWKICSICQTEMGKDEHGFEKCSKVDDATHSCTCECGEFVIENHAFGDWVVTKEASESETGTKEKSCVCGHTVTEEIPQKVVEIDPSNPSTDSEEPNESAPSDTLEENNDASIFDRLENIPKEILIIVGASIAGVILLVIIFVIVKKKRF